MGENVQQMMAGTPDCQQDVPYHSLQGPINKHKEKPTTIDCAVIHQWWAIFLLCQGGIRQNKVGAPAIDVKCLYNMCHTLDSVLSIALG